jgi:transposase
VPARPPGVLEQVTPAGAIAQARHELAVQFLEDLRNRDTQLRETRKKLPAAVKASHTTLTVVFGLNAHRTRQ